MSRNLASFIPFWKSYNKGLSIGVYGYTGAGKSQFIYNLLRYWEDRNELHNPSDQVRQFLHEMTDRLKLLTGPTQSAGITATYRHWDDMQLTWVQQISPVERNHYCIHMHDLPGELLDQEIRQDVPPGGPLASLVQSCDAFLFFFSPVNLGARVDHPTHFETELRRLRALLKVLRTGRTHLTSFWLRGPGIRPLIVVITCKDKWENDPDMRQRVDDWVRKAHGLLRHEWHGAPVEMLDSSNMVTVANPPPLSTQRVPPEQGKQLQDVIVRLFSLAQLRGERLLPGWVVAGILLILVVIGSLAYLFFGRPDPRLQQLVKNLQMTVSDWDNVTKTEADCEKVNKQVIEACAFLTGFVGNEYQRQTIADLLDQIGSKIRAEMESLEMPGEDYEKHLQRWNCLLKRIKHVERVKKLGECQQTFWNSGVRNWCLHCLRQVNNSEEAVSKIERLKDTVERYEVPPGPENIIRELRECKAFLTTKQYSVKLDATLRYKGEDSNRRFLWHMITFPNEDQSVPTKWALDPKELKGTFVRQNPIDILFRVPHRHKVLLGLKYLDFAGKELEVSPAWENNENIGPLHYLGFPFLAPRDSAFELKTKDYELTLKVLETEPKWAEVPVLIQKAFIKGSTGGNRH